MTTAITIANRSTDRYARVNYVLKSEDRIADGAKMPGHTETLLKPGEESCLLHIYNGTSIRVEEGDLYVAPSDSPSEESVEPVYPVTEETGSDL